MSQATFYLCEENGVVVAQLRAGEVELSCCGKPMKKLTANTTDAATEKHVPAVTVEGDVLTAVVGEVEHPMLDEHYITFLCVETESGLLFEELKPGQEPKATFNLGGKKAVAVYEYCNLHGLWVKEL
ncbi:desulfoferrodoxin [Eggerthellaceae bacterium zg-1084]|uniref:Desulfoferrodoxin n=1 Tax=Berryella wangjianweii TaxID=2734634 RepID=A0A6M8J5J0_9ACTN|nr:desulfoferrodoxin family protein [Berryella wangjianweii]NPD31416.1 desulfoferrodoxin [Berryella wangjianweii]NPD32277.1 desulfoferrodoxin [Eggerthellaceae bacterium zg-997]QKF06948.1 desulfoferrodoxin [Berryella wangjianweii]